MKKYISQLLSGILLCISINSCEKPTQPSYPKPQDDSVSWGDKLTTVWKVPRITGGPDYWGTRPATMPLITQSKIIFLYDRNLQCLNKETGETIWQVNVPKTSWDFTTVANLQSQEMILENNKLFVVADRFAECRDVETGVRLWRYELTNDDFRWDFSRYSQSDNALFLTTNLKDELIALSKSSGTVLWSNSDGLQIEGADPQSSFSGPASYFNSVVYVGLKLYPGLGNIVKYAGGGIAAFDANTGKLLWKKVLPDPDAAILGYPNWQLLASNRADATIFRLPDGLIFTAGFTVTKTDFEGNIRWRRAIHNNGTTSEITGSSVLHNGNFFSHNNGDGAGAIAFSINSNNGDVNWQSMVSRNGSIHTILMPPPQIDGSTVYKMTNDNWLFGHDIHTGALAWSSNLSTAEIKDGQQIPFVGAMKVEDKRVYFINAESILCMERK